MKQEQARSNNNANKSFFPHDFCGLVLAGSAGALGYCEKENNLDRLLASPSLTIHLHP